MDVKNKLLLHPHRIQTVVCCKKSRKKSVGTTPNQKSTARGFMATDNGLTYDICFTLAAVVISSTDLHLHKGAHNAAAIFRQMTGPQHLKAQIQQWKCSNYDRTTRPV